MPKDLNKLKRRKNWELEIWRESTLPFGESSDGLEMICWSKTWNSLVATLSENFIWQIVATTAIVEVPKRYLVPITDGELMSRLKEVSAENKAVYLEGPDIVRQLPLCFDPATAKPTVALISMDPGDEPLGICTWLRTLQVVATVAKQVVADINFTPSPKRQKRECSSSQKHKNSSSSGTSHFDSSHGTGWSSEGKHLVSEPHLME